MKTALASLALLVCLAFAIWRAAKRAGRAEVELKNAQKNSKIRDGALAILSSYINLSSAELLSRVREKRAATSERMRTENRLDGQSTGQSERQE